MLWHILKRPTELELMCLCHGARINMISSLFYAPEKRLFRVHTSPHIQHSKTYYIPLNVCSQTRRWAGWSRERCMYSFLFSYSSSNIQCYLYGAYQCLKSLVPCFTYKKKRKIPECFEWNHSRRNSYCGKWWASEKKTIERPKIFACPMIPSLFILHRSLFSLDGVPFMRFVFHIFIANLGEICTQYWCVRDAWLLVRVYVYRDLNSSVGLWLLYHTKWIHYFGSTF